MRRIVIPSKRLDKFFGFLLIETLANQLGAELSVNTTNGFSYHIKWENNVGKAEV